MHYAVWRPDTDDAVEGVQQAAPASTTCTCKHTFPAMHSQCQLTATCPLVHSRFCAHCHEQAKSSQVKVSTLGLFAYPVLMAADILLYRYKSEKQKRGGEWKD